VRKGIVMALASTLLIILLGLGPGTGQECRDLSIVVDVQGVDAKPGPAEWPFDVRVLTGDGTVLKADRTRDGKAGLRVCWSPRKPPAGVEVTWGDGGAIQGEIRGYDGRQRGLCFLVCPIHRSDCE